MTWRIIIVSFLLMFPRFIPYNHITYSPILSDSYLRYPCYTANMTKALFYIRSYIQRDGIPTNTTIQSLQSQCEIEDTSIFLFSVSQKFCWLHQRYYDNLINDKDCDDSKLQLWGFYDISSQPYYLHRIHRFPVLSHFSLWKVKY